MKWFSPLAVCAGLLVLGCSENDNPSGGSGPAPVTSCGKVLLWSSVYRQKASDTLIVVTPERVDTARSCSGGSMVSTPVVMAADTETVLFRLKGVDTLLLTNEGLTAIIGLVADVVPYLVYAREGAGAGMLGAWCLKSLTYEDPRGTTNIFTRAILDSMIRVIRQEYASAIDNFYLVITSTSIMQYERWPAADELLASWSADSARYDIAAIKRSECEVCFVGRVTGEKVTVWGDQARTITYVSSSPAYPMHVYYEEDPRECPNTEKPPWWDQFLNGNAR